MDIPKDVKTYDMPSSTIWIKDGIVYSTPKPNLSHEIGAEQMKSGMVKFKEVVGDEKICLVVEINPRTKSASKQERDIVAAEIANITKAMALITSSPVTKMIANLFFGFKPPPYHVKMFMNEQDATNWIKQYL